MVELYCEVTIGYDPSRTAFASAVSVTKVLTVLEPPRITCRGARRLSLNTNFGLLFCQYYDSKMLLSSRFGC